MENIIKIKSALMVFAMALLMAACSEAPKGDSASITDAQETAAVTGRSFVVDTADSKVRFTGHGVGKNHPATFRLASGTVAVQNEQVTGGEFVIDIKSLEPEEEGAMFQDKLKPHLLSGDFFDADNFGTAKFEITSVEPYEANSSDTSVVDGANFRVSGNLTIKDVTKNVSFPAFIEMDDNQLKAKANFDIDRREWKMNYGNDKTLGDKFISETVNIELDLKATNQQRVQS